MSLENTKKLPRLYRGTILKLHKLYHSRQISAFSSRCAVGMKLICITAGAKVGNINIILPYTAHHKYTAVYLGKI